MDTVETKQNTTDTKQSLSKQNSKQDSKTNSVSYNSESPTVSSLLNYSRIVKSICKSSGLFRSRYKQAESQLINMNRIMEQVFASAVPSIKNDIYNIILKNIDWNQYKERLVSDLKRNSKTDTISKNDSRTGTVVPKNDSRTGNGFGSGNVFHLKKLNFEMNDDTPQIETEYISDMNLAIYNLGIDEGTKPENLTLKQKKRISNFIEIRDELFNEIDNNINDFKEFENVVSETRLKNIDTMKQNLEILYSAHLRHADNKLRKRNERIHVFYDNKEIMMNDSQREFITNAINSILNMK